MKENNKIKKLSLMFIAGMALSGLSVIPLEMELEFAKTVTLIIGIQFSWINDAILGVTEIKEKFPFMFYGTDWLAFCSLSFAILFIGVYKDPVRNIWVTNFCILACVLIFPFAFIAGFIRDIPISWRLIDCSFGIIGLLILAPIRKLTLKLNNYEQV